jgi:hypothetical protein
MLGPLYKIRSGTARGGRLHGTETAAGAFFTFRYERAAKVEAGSAPSFSPISLDALQLFTRMPQTARHIARRLIIRILGVR